jgi:hypothetical protein
MNEGADVASVKVKLRLSSHALCFRMLSVCCGSLRISATAECQRGSA